MLDATNPFFTDVAQGIEAAAEAVDLSLVLCNSGQRGARAAHLERLQQQRVQGILVTPVDPESPTARRDPAAWHAGGDRRPHAPRPHLLLGGGRRRARRSARRRAPGGPRARADRIRRRPDVAGAGARPAAGARGAWADAGRAATDLTVIATAALDVGEGREAGGGWRDCRDPAPTAAFCANDLVALGLLQQAIGAGIRVPEELAIVGYDDIEFAAAAAVPLTSVRQPRHELGRAAAELAAGRGAPTRTTSTGRSSAPRAGRSRVHALTTRDDAAAGTRGGAGSWFSLSGSQETLTSAPCWKPFRRSRRPCRTRPACGCPWRGP